MNLLILLYLLILAPKLFIDRIWKGKRHPGFLQRIGLQIPKVDQPVIWIHAVSVGEVKAAQPLFKALKQKEKDAFFLITTTSATGQAEAQRSLKEADAFAYLPLDLTWVVNRWVKKLKPKRFILIESDFWLHLLTALKKHGTQIDLVSGKLSERSARRFHFFPRFARKLFSHFDHLCVQNEDYFHRFLPLIPDPSRLHVTGNLKLDLQSQPLSTHLELPQPAIAITCTHFPEEEQLLTLLAEGPWFLILAPRHPERFEEVAQLLTRKQIPFTRWSQSEKLQKRDTPTTHKVLLVDTMGQLPLCYSSAQLAILGGSYVSHIGGHNLLEPCLYHVPVLFGPHTFGQKEFATRILESGAGACVPLSELNTFITSYFNDPVRQQAMRQAAQKLIANSRGATARTIDILFSS